MPSALGKKRLASITPQDCQWLYRRKLDAGLAPRTVKHIHEVLHNALADATAWGLVPRNVADLASPPRVPEQEQHALTPEQARRLLAAVQGTQLDCIVSLALTTGMREGELLGLRWSAVDLEAGVLRVSRQLQRVARQGILESEPKTKRSRRPLLLTPIGIKALERQREMVEGMRLAAGPRWEECDLVHPNRYGRPLETSRLWTRFDKVRTELGLPDVRFHDLRHSTATLLLSLGIHPKVVQEILGHSQIGITLDLYSDHVPAMHSDAMERLNGLLEHELEQDPDD